MDKIKAISTNILIMLIVKRQTLLKSVNVWEFEKKNLKRWTFYWCSTIFGF